ncbi:MAG: bifunctional N-acetylglucosamine-1-phosphate uridyltransferase/glucosamine-1-phosphate acetyltransferase [Candidatus Gastranaerophilales bacterium]|nr:bifunctional N-acetylglucosamine-1-phosphate uridyltransferase/glucosamine-1-phosphate acetyltransferase [Candidatus Gastranaerophilales bacterium]
MDSEIKAIVLAAGKGTRMKSSLVKVLHEIFSKPLLAWVLDALNNLPYKTENIVIVGHCAQAVEEYLEKNYQNAKTATQKEQLGTGHAVAQALPLLEGYDGKVIITCGDTPLLTTKTLNEFIQYHDENKSDLTVMTTKFENPFGYGRIIRDKNNQVEKIVEQKDATEEEKLVDEVNTGVYCLEWSKIKQAFSELKNNNAQGEYYLTDIVKWANEKSLKVAGFVAKDSSEIYGINSRQNLEIATKIMKDRYLDELMTQGVTIVDRATTFISPETTIGEDTIIYPNTYINGKNEIAKNCKVGPMTHIRGNCSIAEGCKIGNFVELKNAKIAKKTNVCHLTYVGDANIGEHVNIGAGTIFANYNSITKEKKSSTLGNNVSIGSNTVIVAPCVLGENAFVGAGSVITKDVEKDALAICRNVQKEYKNWVKLKKGEN